MFSPEKIAFKPFTQKAFLATPTMHGEELDYIRLAYDTNWMSTVGENINEVERIAAEKAEVGYAVGLACCTAALHLCVKLAGERLYGKSPISHGALEGQRVFCSDMTFDATLNPVVYEGGIPVFIDTEADSWNMDPVALEQAFTLYPEVKLGKYKGLAAPMPQAELSNDDVDKAESEWLQAHLVEEERDRAAMGDEVTLDFDGSVDGVPFDGGKAENYPLLLGSGMFIDGFEEQVAGIRPEEEREIHVTFPQQYTPELAGKAAVFRVKAHRIVRRSMPELNDEFARAQGFSDAAALRAMYTDEQICALLGVFEASDEEIERARARIERKRRKDQLTSGLCACIMIVATIAGLVMLFVPEYETPYFWLAWAIGGLLCAVVAIAVGSFVKDQPSQ